MKKLSLSLLTLLSLFLYSCTKDNSENTNNASSGELKGTWNLVNIDVEGNVSSELSSVDYGSAKSLMLFDYITENNQGSIIIDDTSMTSNGISYKVTGTTSMKQYIDGTLITDVDSVMNVTVTPSNSTASYVRVSADSIYCPNGSLISVQNVQQMFSEPAGIKYRFEGDKLIMTITQNEINTVSEDGVTEEDKLDYKCIATFKKP